MSCDIISDEDTSPHTSDIITVYEPEELNNLLLSNTENIARKLGNVSITGDINTFYKWRSSGCSIKISHNNKSFECKVWTHSGLSPDYVQQFENTRCIVTGKITAEYWKTHKFVLEVNSIKLINNDTKLEKLKEQCCKLRLFDNKKEIDYRKIGTITIISKYKTQGYDDFINQFNVPINIKLKQITLEGEKTSKECVKAIEESQDSDLIIIVRGGGDTSEISNSFDTLDIFTSIKKSNVPIITAIGHEQDKGDKLLITQVSDLDLPTPTALAKFLNCKLYEFLLDKLDMAIKYNDEIFGDIYQNQYKKLYNALESYINVFISSKIGGPIIEVQNEKEIIVKKNNRYYLNKLSFANEIDITNSDINDSNKLREALEDQNFKLIGTLLVKMSSSEEKIDLYAIDIISKINRLIKINNKFEQIDYSKNNLYLVQLKTSKSLNKIVQIKQILQFYRYTIQQLIKNMDVCDINILEIYNFICNNI